MAAHDGDDVAAVEDLVEGIRHAVIVQPPRESNHDRVRSVSSLLYVFLIDPVVEGLEVAIGVCDVEAVKERGHVVQERAVDGEPERQRWQDDAPGLDDVSGVGGCDLAA